MAGDGNHPGNGGSDGSSSASGSHRPAVSDDAKAKFREALERKKSAQHRTEGGTNGSGVVHGSETSGPTQRRFQRKSGSS